MSLQRFPVLGELAHTSTAAAVFLYVSTTGNVFFVCFFDRRSWQSRSDLKNENLKKEKDDVGLLGFPPLKHS